MPFTLAGYVVEGVRVGQANGTFTQTPDNLISDQAAFDTAYPADESAPRTDYMVLVTDEGLPYPGLLVNAQFGWTKNEVIDRFNYNGQRAGFRPMPGAAPVAVGYLGASSNTDRLKARPPAQIIAVSDAPIRLSVGTTGSGQEFAVTVVATEGDFATPSPGTVEMALDKGTFNWNPADLVTNFGQLVRFQQQQFYDPKDSTGNLGFAPTLITDPELILNPKPGTAQYPLIRFGYTRYLTPVEVPDELSFSADPTAGSVEWALTTGMCKFNSGDASDNSGVPVYYDGVLFGLQLTLPNQTLGDISSPASISGLPSEGVDLIFSLPNATKYYQFPEFTYIPSSAFNSGKKGIVQVDPDTGAVNFSDADKLKYAGQEVRVTFGDLPIERGLSMRFFRNPVNLDASQDIKDVSEIYTVESATWSSPIQQSPQVSIPSIPIDDRSVTPTYPLTVEVGQGQGSYTDTDFPRLDLVTSLTEGFGYFIDFDTATFYFAKRVIDQTQELPRRTSDIVLPDPLLLTGNFELELNTGSGWDSLVPGQDVVLDATSGVAQLTISSDTLASGAAVFSGTTLLDAGASFVAAGVQPGALLEVLSPAAGIYTILGVGATTLTTDLPYAGSNPVTYRIWDSREILADRFFSEVTLLDPSTHVERYRDLGVAANSPRLAVPVANVLSTGIQLNDVPVTVVVVPDDGSFTVPVTGTVEVSATTGNLNFAIADLGSAVTWVWSLILKTDYLISSELGLIQLMQPMLAGESASITYTTEPPVTVPATPAGAPQTEPATFEIHKELTQDHPVPTSTLVFNPNNIPVASNPAPAVFRGGRPQDIGKQCNINSTPSSSTITFLNDTQLTDALPHGAIIQPNERVYIDYNVTQAIGGEETFTVLNPPIKVININIEDVTEDGEDNNQFVVPGDQTANFPADTLMRIEASQVYLIGNSTYDAGSDTTTVVLAGQQVFQDAFYNPTIYVASGPTPFSTYYVPEVQSFDAIPRKSDTLTITGDRSGTYRVGTVLLFVTGAYSDYALVVGVEFDADLNQTKLSLAANVVREYQPGTTVMYYSIRPVFEAPVTQAVTSRIPLLMQPYVVYRRVDGQVGEVLSPSQYTIDNNGNLSFRDPLGLDEEWSIMYTGLRLVGAGSLVRATYTCQITPDDLNGIKGQVLLASYSTSSPDSFYFRVEPISTFRDEYATEIKSAASSGSSGPQTSNVSQPKLYEQGRPSLYFTEHHILNQDLIARATLLYYHDLCTYLETYRKDLDGSVVGNNDGALLYDGTLGDTHPPGAVTNQIDDTIQVSPAPYEVVGPPFTVVSIGTYQKYYLPGPLSRFYPTLRGFFGVTAITSTPSVGDEVLDTGAQKILQVSDLHTRLAWAIVTEKAFTGETVLQVDDSDGDASYIRPPFLTGMKCVIQNRDGTFVHNEASPVTVSAIGGTTLTISALSGTVEPGCTIYRSPSDDSVQSDPYELIDFVLNQDYSFNSDSGQLTYVASNGLASPNNNNPLVANEALTGQVSFNNVLTAPYQFPALYGGTEDDDGDLSFPIQTPDPDSEQLGYLQTESYMLAPSTGKITSLVTDASSSTATMTMTTPTTSNQITFVTASINPSTVRAYDLVRVTSGVNAGSVWRRVNSSFTSLGNTSVTVIAGDDWVYDSNPVTFEIATASPVWSGTNGFFPNLTTLTDATAAFTTTVKVGETVVITSQSNIRLRRQISAITNNTTLVLDQPVSFVITNPLTPSQYRVIASITSYGDTAQDYKTTLADAVSNEPALYLDEIDQLEAFLVQAQTPRVTSSNGNLSGSVLTDTSVDFAAEGVEIQDVIYLASGPNAGFYEVQTVATNSLTILGTFPSAQDPAPYQVSSVLGVSLDSLNAVFELIGLVDSWYTAANTFYGLLTSSDTVNNDGSAYATSLRMSDLNSRYTTVQARITEIADAVQVVADVLENVDKVYDARYVWIDARINLQDGLQVQYATAVANRMKAQIDTYNQLIKLLAVQGS